MKDWDEMREHLRDIDQRVDRMPVTKMPDLQQKFIEELAALEHDQWMSWAKSISEHESISPERRRRWETLMIPYSDLSEEMKEHDRQWARKVFECVKRHIDD